jgi:hypothetical protein
MNDSDLDCKAIRSIVSIMVGLFYLFLAALICIFKGEISWYGIGIFIMGCIMLFQGLYIRRIIFAEMEADIKYYELCVFY